MTSLPIIDPNSKPFENRSWSHSSANSCSLTLFNRDILQMDPTGRPDRIVSLDRRDQGSFLHEASYMSMKLLMQRQQWPVARKVAELLLNKGPFSHMVHHVGEFTKKIDLFQRKFLFNTQNALTKGGEMAICIDKEGNIASFDQPPPGSWRGRIDWPELDETGQLRIIDYKNRPAVYPRAELIENGQLSGYGVALSRHYPQVRARPLKQGIYYFEYGITDEVEISWEQADENYAIEQAKTRHKMSLTRAMVRPEPGFGRCQYCEYLNSCPEGLSLLDDKQSAPVDEETAKSLGRKLFVVGEIYDAGRKALKKFVDEHGPVKLDEETGYGNVITEDKDIDTKEVARILKKNGQDPWTVLRVATDDFKKLLEALDENEQTKKIADELRACIKVREKTTFKEFKPKRAKVRTTPRPEGRVRGRGRGKASES
jgi:hypothetical protein